MQMVEHLNKHIKEKKGIHIERALDPKFGWDVIINHLQKCADGEYAGAPYDILSYQLNEAEKIPEVKEVIDYLNTFLELKIFDCHIFTSFTKGSKTKIHIDNHNVIMWAIAGEMAVNCYQDENEENLVYSKKLNIGDMFFVPANVHHRIVPLGARALVSFGIEVEPGINYNSTPDNLYAPLGKY